MQRHQRLRRRRDFEHLTRTGRMTAGDLLSVRVAPNGLEHNRFAFAVGKRVGKAVVRNRVKRRMREAIRTLPLAAGHDVLVIARAPAAAVTYDEIVRAVSAVLRRARLLSRT